MNQKIGRLLLVHAHPDDEASGTGGVIAKYSHMGYEVTVVTCTLGEEGEVFGEKLDYLQSSKNDQLGGYRYGELQNALKGFSSDDNPVQSVILGGVARWRDSGMVWGSSGFAEATDTTDPRRFSHYHPGSDGFKTQVAELQKVIQEKKPHVVITYDSNGGYGHPDHIQAHLITVAAVAETNEPGFDRWKVPVLFANLRDLFKFYDEYLKFKELDLPKDWIMIDRFEKNPPHKVVYTTEVKVDLDQKRAGLKGHESQLFVKDGIDAFILTNMTAIPMPPMEWFNPIGGYLKDQLLAKYNEDHSADDLFTMVEL